MDSETSMSESCDMTFKEMGCFHKNVVLFQNGKSAGVECLIHF